MIAQSKGNLNKLTYVMWWYAIQWKFIIISEERTAYSLWIIKIPVCFVHLWSSLCSFIMLLKFYWTTWNFTPEIDEINWPLIQRVVCNWLVGVRMSCAYSNPLYCHYTHKVIHVRVLVEQAMGYFFPWGTCHVVPWCFTQIVLTKFSKI
jgi:hypothetical protein